MEDPLRISRFYSQRRFIDFKKKLSVDVRDEFKHDYDRILYSSYLRRLDSVTQIFNPSEGVIFHNRLTHSMKVSQIGRRLAQYIIRQNRFRESIKKVGGISSEVVAAAGLAHDLGNPPFGHAAEDELNDLIKVKCDGFEGNAQTFRIVTKLACHTYRNLGYGLNLTAATLNAILKYPWMYKQKPVNKFGVYSTEEDVYSWCRKLYPELELNKSLEASIMDLSDDITYAIHDFLDLWRSDLLPLLSYYELFLNDIINLKNRILTYYKSDEELKTTMRIKNFLDPLVIELIEILKNTREEWAPTWEPDQIENIIDSLHTFFAFIKVLLIRPVGPYRGTGEERAGLKDLESTFIIRFLSSLDITITKSNPCALIVRAPACDEIIILKSIAKSYIFNSSRLIKQQYGERKIIRGLFDAYNDAIDREKIHVILPERTREELARIRKNELSEDLRYRIIGDAISGLSDSEAILTYNRLYGTRTGSIFER
jgi:dGTPase